MVALIMSRTCSGRVTGSRLFLYYVRIYYLIRTWYTGLCRGMTGKKIGLILGRGSCHHSTYHDQFWLWCIASDDQTRVFQIHACCHSTRSTGRNHSKSGIWSVSHESLTSSTHRKSLLRKIRHHTWRVIRRKYFPGEVLNPHYLHALTYCHWKYIGVLKKAYRNDQEMKNYLWSCIVAESGAWNNKVFHIVKWRRIKSSFELKVPRLWSRPQQKSTLSEPCAVTTACEIFWPSATSQDHLSGILVSDWHVSRALMHRVPRVHRIDLRASTAHSAPGHRRVTVRTSYCSPE